MRLKTMRRSVSSSLVLMLSAMVLLCFAPWLAAADKDELEYLPAYYKMRPSFVTNITSEDPTEKVLVQIQIELMANHPTYAKKLKYHKAPIRNSILMLLSQQNKETLTTLEGREALRKESLKNIRKIMQREEGHDTIEKVLFTKFIIKSH